MHQGKLRAVSGPEAILTTTTVVNVQQMYIYSSGKTKTSLRIQMLLLLVVIFQIVTEIQEINTYFMEYNSWSFHLSYITETYDLNTINKW